MSTPRVNYNPKILKEICSLNYLKKTPFVLFDIGVSQGIEDHWLSLGDNLRAIGFDPLIKEINRLNNENQNKNIVYYDAFITSPKKKSKKNNKSHSWAPNSYQRSSAIKASEIIKKPFKYNFNNNDPELLLSEKIFSIDEYCHNNNLENVDFIKIDTDGSDLDVINGALETLNNKNVLGLFVECQFQGGISNNDNTFANIDKVLRNNGYSLFDLETYRYSKKALPDQFSYDIFAQTQSGQILAGDALYIRDYLADGYKKKFVKLSKLKLFKLIIIFEIYGLDDCAAELIIEMEKEKIIPNKISVKWLDILANRNRTKYQNYSQLIHAFNTNPRLLYPSSFIRKKLSNYTFARNIYRKIKSLL